MRLSDLAGRSVAVWGTGREAVAAIAALESVGPTSLVAVEHNAITNYWHESVGSGVPLHTGEHALNALATAEVVIKSPGISKYHPWIRQLQQHSITITSGTALWLADHAPATIGVTGSKGKSTTSSLIHHFLTRLGVDAVVGGNIGLPVLNLPPARQYVVEMSSHQCADSAHSPRVAVITSLFPDHIDWHGSVQQYYRDKLSIARHHPQQVVINGLSDVLLEQLPLCGVSQPVTYAATPQSWHVVTREGHQWLAYQDQLVCDRRIIPLLGDHNVVNVAVALAAVQASGVDCVGRLAEVVEAVTSFVPLPHRLTPISDPSGITFVDDTLSTNVDAAIAAVKSCQPHPVTLIVGGTDRGIDYRPLRDFCSQVTDPLSVIGIPDNGKRIIGELEGLPEIAVRTARTMQQAVALARNITPNNGYVILSPAAPSFGRYANYEEKSADFLDAIESTRE